MSQFKNKIQTKMSQKRVIEMNQENGNQQSFIEDREKEYFKKIVPTPGTVIIKPFPVINQTKSGIKASPNENDVRRLGVVMAKNPDVEFSEIGDVVYIAEHCQQCIIGFNTREYNDYDGYFVANQNQILYIDKNRDETSFNNR